MKGESGYVPPSYIPLGQSDSVAEAASQTDFVVEVSPRNDDIPVGHHRSNVPAPWSSGICACCDDMQSCCVGLVCPCFLFGKNAEFLGSGTLIGSCMTHFILWALMNMLCCLLTDGVLFGLPGCFVACYACGYRRTLRAKYDLQEAPCRDFVTHFFCHLCAICQEYREIRERSSNSSPPDLNLMALTAPPVQTMEPASKG
ncbi:protein PLANT CADMIUM RESISTANCE 10 [Cornus florida]|uniref:protein PLANT CADMIUM RESISTANCE 10 n=1 Tax=Cornus florida TaxID=4283 RepID=UPI00289D300C|nr:protein PLANT CADMIUM RESISTANCE 10 [Cornus florida]